MDAPTYLNDPQRVAWKTAMEALLALPWTERKDVITALRCNDIFCWSCGIGEPDRPNINCQCWNDE